MVNDKFRKISWYAGKIYTSSFIYLVLVSHWFKKKEKEKQCYKAYGQTTHLAAAADMMPF